MDCSLPDSSIRGIFQARVLEWVAISSSRGSSQPRDWTQVSCIAGRRFTVWAKGVIFSKMAWVIYSEFLKNHKPLLTYWWGVRVLISVLFSVSVDTVLASSVPKTWVKVALDGVTWVLNVWLPQDWSRKPGKCVKSHEEGKSKDQTQSREDWEKLGKARGKSNWTWGQGSTGEYLVIGQKCQRTQNFWAKSRDQVLQDFAVSLSLCFVMLIAVHCVKTGSISCSVVSDSVTPWTIHGIIQPFPSPGDLSNQGSNLGLQHCRWTLYCLNHPGSLRSIVLYNGSVPSPHILVLKTCNSCSVFQQLCFSHPPFFHPQH